MQQYLFIRHATASKRIAIYVVRGKVVVRTMLDGTLHSVDVV